MRNQVNLSIGGKPDTEKFTTTVGIRPLGVEKISSEMEIKFFKTDGGKQIPLQSGDHVAKQLPTALWAPKALAPAKGNEPIDGANSKIDNVLTGVHVRPARPQETPPIRAPRTAAQEGASIARIAGAEPPRAEAPSPNQEDGRKKLGKLLANAAQRERALSELRSSFGFGDLPSIDMAPIAQGVLQPDVLLAPPLFVALGGLPPLARGG